MAIIIQNPDNVPGAVSTGYQLQNELIYAHIAGFTNIYFSPDYSYMRAGSIFEINGTLVKCQNDENVTDLQAITKNNYFYIYARLINTTTVNLQASITEPIWDIGKCGFYDNNRRALIKLAKDKISIKEVDFKTNFINSNVLIPTGGGTLNPNLCVTGTIGASGSKTEVMTINQGWYRAVIKGGGGAGGAGFSRSGYGTVTGGKGGNGGYINVKFFVPFNDYTLYVVGGNGGGGNGGDSSLFIKELGINYISYGGKAGANAKGENNIMGNYHTVNGEDGANGGNNINIFEDTGGAGGTGGSGSKYDMGPGNPGKSGTPGSVQIYDY